MRLVQSDPRQVERLQIQKPSTNVFGGILGGNEIFIIISQTIGIEGKQEKEKKSLKCFFKGKIECMLC